MTNFPTRPTFTSGHGTRSKGLKPSLSLVFYDREQGKETLVKRYRSVSSDLPSSRNLIHQPLMFQLQINWLKTEFKRHDADQG